jgi:RNA polymerase sigma-70 factor (ECF subfamily)
MSSSEPTARPEPPRPFWDGDDAAAQELFQRYAKRLARLAERQLSADVAVRLDGEDVVQSVFRTFFRRCAQGEFQIDSSTQLWRLLVKITVRKAQARARRHTAAARDVRREAALAEGQLLEALAREPGPDEAAALVDQVGALLRGLPPLYENVLDMRLQGRSVAEIADSLGLARQTIYRVLTLLGDRLRSMDGEI